jgi:hypothetical protein
MPDNMRRSGLSGQEEFTPYRARVAGAVVALGFVEGCARFRWPHQPECATLNDLAAEECLKCTSNLPEFPGEEPSQSDLVSGDQRATNPPTTSKEDTPGCDHMFSGGTALGGKDRSKTS